MSKKSVIFFLSILSGISVILGDVPPQRIHRPEVPYLLQSIRFETVRMSIFDPQVSGMVMDPYSDLHWNPAFVLNQTGKSVYLDFNPGIDVQVFRLPVYTLYSDYNRYSTAYMVTPRWYSSTSVNTVDSSPIYNVAVLAAVSPRISIGFINRSLFDYGPFRNQYRTYYGYEDSFVLFGPGDAPFPSDLEPQRLEVDNNQQTVLGTQSELSLGYRVLNNLDLGIRLGYFAYGRDGTLYDSKWATYPHSSFANLEDESLEIKGNHTEMGLGIVYRLGDRTRIGVYGGYVTGDASENIASLDTFDAWWERDTDTSYYRITEFSLDSRESYSSKGKRPNATLTFESNLSPKVTIRSFLHGSRSTLDVSGTVESSDTTYGDWTYDTWRYPSYHFQRRESHSSREANLDGGGEEIEQNWRWFASLIYGFNQDWSAFAGLLIDYHTFERTYDELSDYRSHRLDSYTLYDEAEYRNLYRQDQRYLVTGKREAWSLFLPIALKAEVVRGLSVIVGTDLTLNLSDQEDKGKLLYPERITRKWEDDELVVEDIEIDRYEEFTSEPAKMFSRSIQQRFGIQYEHPSGARVFVRSKGDVFHTANWALGFEMTF